MSEKLLRNILSDIKVELTDEFDKNFERKGFFSTKWAKTKMENRKGSLMNRTGFLRRSIRSKISATGITFESDAPSAEIHNEGGEITVTAKMKRFFWAMYYSETGAIKKSKYGREIKSKANARRQENGSAWKAMAMMKVGSKIKIPKRQFIGNAPEVENIIRQIIEENMKEAINQIALQP